MKKVAIMQPYLFPYLGYFQMIKAVDEFVVYDDVQFIKGGWVNRNNILMNKEKKLFTIPLNGASANKRINEIQVMDDFKKFLITIQLVYAKAPYIVPAYELLQRICSYPDRQLARFAGNSLKRIAEYLQIDTQFVYSSELSKDTSLKGQGKVIAICKELGADIYINAIGGRELYQKETFTQHGLNLFFINMLPVTYKQFGNDFVPSLSIIDVLMFNSPADVNKLLDRYELV